MEERQLQILCFLEGTAKDDFGRCYTDILKMNFIQFEVIHTWVQWAFPTVKPSEHLNNPPVIDMAGIERFRSSEKAKENIRTMYAHALRFYKLDGHLYKVKMFRYWTVRENHNVKRITRMLECFQLLGMEEEYKDLTRRLSFIIQHQDEVGIYPSQETIKHWKEAFYKEDQEASFH